MAAWGSTESPETENRKSADAESQTYCLKDWKMGIQQYSPPSKKKKNPHSGLLMHKAVVPLAQTRRR